MEYQRKVRKKRLCILIYNNIHFLLVCGAIILVPASTTTTTTSAATALPPSSLLQASLNNQSTTNIFLSSSALPLEPSSSSSLSHSSLASSSSKPLLLPQTHTTLPPSQSSPSSIPSALIASNASSSPAASLLIAPQTISGTARKQRVCAGVHVRNDLKSFEQLRGCNVIDGPLTIALVSNQTHPFETRDYENITFPELTEITEYLLFFRVQGLSTLSRLFPNLAVIRGRELVADNALIIYEMMHLQKIELPKLSDILRGSVRIESNPNLCFVSTVNWDALCKQAFAPHFIKENGKRCNNRCPTNCRPWFSKNPEAESSKYQGDVEEFIHTNRTTFCWSNLVCHDFCDDNLPPAPFGGCCDPQCAGGCFSAGRSDQCIACRNVIQGDRCVRYCDSNLFEHRGRCVTEQACIQAVENIQQNQCNREAKLSNTNLKAIRLKSDRHGRCQVTCPPGYEEDRLDMHKCKPCDRGKCRKVCAPESAEKPFMVTNVNSLRELSGCNVINGSLEISMKGGENVLHELENAFQELEEIEGYLKITRSYPIFTLGFLRNLRYINGSKLERDEYSLTIIDNPNLQELFIFNQSDSGQRQLHISRGRIFVHLNPKLCPHRIDNLKTYANVAPWDEKDVSRHTNGDKEACTTATLDVQYVQGSARVALIRFSDFAQGMHDPRSLLYYLINYRVAPNGSVTMFDGRDGCNNRNDVWQTVEESPVYKRERGVSTKGDEYQEVAIKVRPATRYALYVKTYMIQADAKNGLSDIIYFETAPDTPGIPRQIESSSTSPESVIIYWLPPSRPNGVIERYTVTVTRLSELEEDLQNLDICDSTKNRDKITQQLTLEEPTSSSFVKNPMNQSSAISENTSPNHNACSRNTLETDPELQQEKVTFQDTVIDIIYLKPCISQNKTVKRKRSIDHDLGDTDSANQNSLPRRTLDSPSPEPVKTSLDSRAKSVAPNTIKFDQKLGKIEASISAKAPGLDHKLTSTIVGLEHYGLYQIEVVACHGSFTGNRTQPPKTYNRCGLQAITQVRTQPIPEQDRILKSTIVFNPANETVPDNIVTWKKPARPNGLVLAYRVRYRPVNGNPEIWTEGCINNTAFNRDGGFMLRDINPGSYLLKVQTVSTYTGQWSWKELEEIEFEIPQNYFVSPAILILIFVFGIILLALGVASGTYYYQKKKNELVYASVNPDYIQYDPDEWEVDISNLKIGAQIGTGAFGMVYKGQLTTEKGTHSCAIKTVPPTSTAKQRMDFLREASIMKQFDTFHVVKLMGVVSTTTPVYVVMEYMENGDLKDFLRAQREIHQRQNKTIVDGVYVMAAQIADGMAYLASKKFVHRDLAARNCMVGENHVVKIGDFGLTRDIYANDYYRRDTHGRLPVRWMAPESLSDNLYTSASDAWSYGIVVWEIVTFSAYPYQGLSNDEVINRVVKGFTMPRPDHCPDKLFNVMERCWRKNDRDRPTFVDIVEYLLPETEGKLYPNCFYRSPKSEDDSIAQMTPEENTTGTESYPLLLRNSTRANGLTNGANHVNRSSNTEGRGH